MAEALPSKDMLVPADTNLSADSSDLPPADNLVPVGKASWSAQAGMRFAATKSDINSATILAEALLPLGNLYGEEGFGYYSPEELYGTEFMNMSFDERRQFLVDKRNEALNKEYEDVLASNIMYGEDTSAALVGSLGAVFSTPTTLIPIGGLNNMRKAMALSGMFGAEWSLLDQYSTKGEVDLQRLGTDVAVATVVPPVLVGAGKTLKFGKELLSRRRAGNLSEINEANKTMDIIDAAYADGVNNKIPTDQLAQHALNTTGLTSEEVAKASSLAGRSPIIPDPGRAKLFNLLATEGTDDVARVKNPLVDSFISSLTRTIGKISQPLKLKFREIDLFSNLDLRKKMKAINPFEKIYKSLPAETKKIFTKHLYNGNFQAAKNIFSSASKDGAEAFDNVVAMKENIFNQLKEHGFELNKVKNYFHRDIIDLDGLRSKLGREVNNVIDDLFKRVKEKRKVAELTTEEENHIVTSYLRGDNKILGLKPKFTKNRTIVNVTDDLLPFYNDPIEGLKKYARSTTSNVAKAKFFDKGNRVINGLELNTSESIGNIINNLNKTNKLDRKDIGLLRDAIEARFIKGEQQGAKFFEIGRSLGYLSTLPNPLSALTQLGDLALSARVNGLRDTIKGMFSRQTNVSDLALDKIAAEFSDTNKLGKALDKFFTISGFKSIDKLGKNTFLNASLARARRLAQTPKGIEKLKSKYGEAYGDRFDFFIDELRNGEKSENVLLYLWSELGNFQPIGLSEYPMKYLTVPNGRMFYSLKTFTLKQIDYMRDTIVDEAAKGNIGTALKNAVIYAAVIPPANMTVDMAKDLMLQRTVDMPDEFGDRYVANIWKIFGASDYLVRHTGQTGKIGTAAQELLLPPVDYIDHIGNVIFSSLDEEKEIDPRVLGSIPLAGRILYNFMGGGLDKFEESRQEKFLSGE